MRIRRDSTADWSEAQDALNADIESGAIEYVGWITRTANGVRFVGIGFAEGRQSLLAHLEEMDKQDGESVRH